MFKSAIFIITVSFRTFFDDIFSADNTLTPKIKSKKSKTPFPISPHFQQGTHEENIKNNPPVVSGQISMTSINGFCSSDSFFNNDDFDFQDVDGRR